MRIRLKKGVALVGAIAGAAIATALIIINVNNGGSMNVVSDIEQVGFFEGLSGSMESAPEGESGNPVVADAQSADAAVAAGLLGEEAAGIAQDTDEASSEETQTATTTGGETADAPSDAAPEGGSAAQSGDVGGKADGEASREAYDSGDASAYETVINEVQTYVEAVPETKTETVVEKNIVRVDRPATVTEYVSFEEEADPVYFYEKTSSASAGEFTDARRINEAEAAKAADMKRLEAAGVDNDWKLPDSEGLLIFY